MDNDRMIEGLGNEVISGVLLVALLLVTIFYLCWSRSSEVLWTIDPTQLPVVARVRRRILGGGDSDSLDENGLPHGHSRPVTVYSSADQVCPICLGPVHLAVTTSCGHVFCGVCLTEYWNIGNWLGSPISCPVCRAQVSLMLISFGARDPADQEQRTTVAESVRRYNRMFSGAPRPLIDYLRDMPVLLPHLARRLFSLDGIMLMFRLRVLTCLILALLYLLSPLDIIPEAVFGVFGLLDDLFILLLLAVYTTVAYRRVLRN